MQNEKTAFTQMDSETKNKKKRIENSFFYRKKTGNFCLSEQKQYLCKPFYYVLHQHARNARHRKTS
jgi:hypothetical protein